MIIILSTSVSCGQSSWQKPKALFNAMKIKKGSWVADIGSGEGDYTVRMAPLVGSKGHIFAVDIDSEKLRELHRNLKDQRIKNVTPVYNMAGTPTLPANSLDAVLIRNAYHEFQNYMGMLQHLKESLKPGGRLVMAEPMEPEVRGASRKVQVEEHSIAINFALEDLKKSGFHIIKKVDRLTANKWRKYWMIIAKHTK